MTREITPPRWALPGGVVVLAFTGLAVGAGMLIGGGVTPVSSPQMRLFPGLESWAWIGLIPIAGAGFMWRFLKRDDRPKVVVSLAVSTVLFVGLLAAFPLLELDKRKATKQLVAESGARQLDREVRVGSFEFTKPSLTFYVGRRVERFGDPAGAAEFLAFPIESYLFVPEPVWEQKVKPLVTTPHRVIARRYDYDKHCDVLVVTNR
jgi:MFS family permease